MPVEELKSGYAEMLKHGMLSGEEEFRQLLDFDFEHADAERVTSATRLPFRWQKTHTKKAFAVRSIWGTPWGMLSKAKPFTMANP